MVKNVKSDLSLPLMAMATLLDLTPRRLQQLAKEGVIPSPAKGKYELVGTVQGYVKYLRDRTLGVELGSEKFAAERARRTSANADIAEIERDRMRGIYLHREEVKMSWAGIVQTVRARMLVIPAKISARLVTLKNPVKVQELLGDEISEALSELAGFTVAASVPPAGSGSGDGNHAGLRAAAEADD